MTTSTPAEEVSLLGTPISEAMIAAATEAVTEQLGIAIDRVRVLAVLKHGLPYSLRGVASAGIASGFPPWLIDAMLDAAVAAIE